MNTLRKSQYSTLHKTLEIETSPHIRAGHSVDRIMRHVVWALIPTCAFSVYIFGLSALITLIVATFTCVLTEHVMVTRSGHTTSVGDWSAVITGVLYGLTLPPGLPLWMVIIGGIIAIGLGKYLFGGLGSNAFNPALVGRAFLQASFPTAMTTWSPILTADRFTTLPASLLTLPFQAPDYSSAAAGVDGVTTATPLALMKFDQQVTESFNLVTGMTAGSYGETCGLLILAGGVYLALRNMLNWRIPVTIFVVCGGFSIIFHNLNPEVYPSAAFTLFSGGLMLGAVFMATDMVASPITHRGAIVYGALIGVLIMVIRYWGGLPEGVMYAILLANAVSPHIDAITQPVVYGTKEQDDTQ